MSGLSALQTVKIQAFLDCAKLSVLVLPDHVVSFASGAFQGCTSLTEVTIPDSYKEIGVKMFQGCIYNHRTTKTNQKYPSVNL